MNIKEITSKESSDGSATLCFPGNLGNIRIMLMLAALSICASSQPLRATQLLAPQSPPILTPKPGPDPRINGPRVYGVRPGHPFLYRIPCTGDRPMEFSAVQLPQGLTIDGSTGIITGTSPAKGEYVVTLGAKNEHGSATKVFKIIVGERISLTPQMGFNDWYSFYNRVTEADMRSAADALISSGMADAGYQYVNVDDCWMGKRDTTGNITGNEKFPDMKALADYIHGKGLKAGLYTSPGPKTCANYEGAFQHEAQDAKQFADWGFDFLKYDWCSYSHVAGKNPDLAAMKKPYQLMGEILKQQSRDIVLNLCQYGMGDVWKWGGEVGNSWRTTGDLGLAHNARLPGFFSIGMSNAHHWACARPGAWNDPDYILIGWVGNAHGLGIAHQTTLTPDEQYSYMSMWALMAAPLFFSGDMTKLDAFTLNVLCNPEVIDVDQDPLGKQAGVLRESAAEFVLVKVLSDGSKAVGLFNLSEKPRTMAVTWGDLGIVGRQIARDLWRQKDIGSHLEKFEASVPPHGVVLVSVRPD